MEAYANTFLELLRYVDYIKDEKIKMQRFFSRLPPLYRNSLELLEPKTLDESIRKVIHNYE